MQKAPLMKASGLKPLSDGDNKKDEQQHVFGKNLEDRVIAPLDEPEMNVKPFTTTQEEDISNIRKRKFDTITGEEDEETAFQSDFTLFTWDSVTANWVEKGRGQLKLNDQVEHNEESFSSFSRIIMRVSGTLRIILNVAINPAYFKVVASTKNNIRFTDSQTVWAARGSSAQQLNDLIVDRLKTSKKLKPEPEAKNATESMKALKIDQKIDSSPEANLETSHKTKKERTKPELDSEQLQEEEHEEDPDRIRSSKQIEELSQGVSETGQDTDDEEAVAGYNQLRKQEVKPSCDTEPDQNQGNNVISENEQEEKPSQESEDSDET